MKSLRSRSVRTLEVTRHPRGVPHVSAASGLVRAGDHLYAVADDEHHLVVISGANERRPEPVELRRLFPGELPDGKKERKKRKPDLECLLGVPAGDGLPPAALLALGSGSRPNRERAAWIRLDGEGRLQGPVHRVSLSPLYDALRTRFEQLNIEGAFVLEDELRLLQRANVGDPRNASIAYSWTAVQRWLAGGKRAPKPLRVDAFDLGAVDGTPWGFTDGAALPGGGWMFSAVAEATDVAYEDAPHQGSMLGLVSRSGRLLDRRRLARRWKVEGIAVRSEPGSIVVDCVTDADDPDRPSSLLRVRWPR